jgi:tetratricopeptide (TPR) repeat protein
MKVSKSQPARAKRERIPGGYAAATRLASRVRLKIHRTLEKWEPMRTVAAKLAAYDPDSVPWTFALAYATRRAQSIEAAKPILLAAVERHPEAAVLHYNVACYECQLGDLEVAKARLAHAFKLDEKLRLRALDDADLEELWGAAGLCVTTACSSRAPRQCP